MSEESLADFQRADVLGKPPAAVQRATGETAADRPRGQYDAGAMQEANWAAGDEGPAEDRQAESHQAAAGQEDGWHFYEPEDAPGPFWSGFEDW